MNHPALTAEEVLAWHEKNSAAWKQLLTEHPEALSIPCDINQTKTVGELLQHIVAVELRYAERLANLPATDYAAIPFDTVEIIYSTHGRATALFRQLLASDTIDWNERIEYMTRMMGPARSSRKTLFFHALFHTARHYAQLATLFRQHGVKPTWSMDYLLMDIEKV
jgi:uncharacterized damage-inducible protein DinB